MNELTAIITAVCACLVSMATMIMGYFKLSRDTRIQNVEEQADTYAAKLSLCTQECQKLMNESSEMQALISAQEKELKSLRQDKFELMSELRELRKKR